ncbi:MAG: hypothetical protein HY537_01470 [Deltaproteobacteria bacterium]|nr:hypothetical protein [Deltaproteobacteria bacterium]
MLKGVAVSILGFMFCFQSIGGENLTDGNSISSQSNQKSFANDVLGGTADVGFGTAVLYFGRTRVERLAGQLEPLLEELEKTRGALTYEQAMQRSGALRNVLKDMQQHGEVIAAQREGNNAQLKQLRRIEKEIARLEELEDKLRPSRDHFHQATGGFTDATKPSEVSKLEKKVQSKFEEIAAATKQQHQLYGNKLVRIVKLGTSAAGWYFIITGSGKIIDYFKVSAEPQSPGQVPVPHARQAAEQQSMPSNAIHFK